MAVRSLNAKFLSTDGRRVLATVLGAATLIDGLTMGPLASFLSVGGGPTAAAFAPGGEVVVAQGGSLAVWPCREVFGVQ